MPEIWSLLVKILLPIIIAWCVWLTDGYFRFRHFMESGERFTREDAYILEMRLPPESWRRRINVLDDKLENLRIANDKLEDEITKEFLRKDEHNNGHK